MEIIEIEKMRKNYIIDTLTSVDICETVEMGGKVIKIYENVICGENFKISPRKFFDNLFSLGQKYKYEGNDLVQGLIELIMNSFYGLQIRADINEFDIKVSLNIGCKENLMIMYWIIRNYVMKYTL